MPSPRVVFALSLAVFATGFTLGAAAGPSAPSSFAAGAGVPGQTIVVLPSPAAPPAPAPTVTQAPAPSTPAPATTPPVEPVPQPAPAADTPAAPSPAETTPAGTTPAGTTPEPSAPALPPVKHVWFVVLSGHGLQDGFGPDSHAALLRDTLPRKGVLLLQHRAVAQGSLANGLALITGRAPTPDQVADCPVYGESCLVPAGEQALTDQLTGAGLTWKAYVEDIGNGGPDTPGACRHPALGQPDPWQAPRPGDASLTPRDPFVYVHSIADAPECATNVVGTEQLTADLERADATPNFSYIVPNACHDGRDTPCTDGALAGTAATDGWLRGVLRQIRTSPAYRKDGLIVVTFDHGPDTDTPVGALLLSHFLAPGTTVDTPTDHVTLLKTVEDLFGLGHLGRAADDDVPALGADVLTRPAS